MNLCIYYLKYIRRPLIITSDCLCTILLEKSFCAIIILSTNSYKTFLIKRLFQKFGSSIEQIEFVSHININIFAETPFRKNKIHKYINAKQNIIIKEYNYIFFCYSKDLFKFLYQQLWKTLYLWIADGKYFYMVE